MNIALIAAMDSNRVIGNNNRLPWHMPADLQHFKALTIAKPIVMGRKTYASIGRPLPQRRNLVISGQPQLAIPGCEVFTSLTAALQAVVDCAEVMVIGGESIFRQALPRATRLYLTMIQHEFVGDTFFPTWDEQQWLQQSSEYHAPDANNPYAYTFVQWQRVQTTE